LLYPSSTGDPLDFRVRNARVLADLTEHVLTVNKLQVAAPEALEVQPKPLKFSTRTFRHDLNDLGLRQACCILETLANSVPSPRPSDDELHLGKVREFAVVDIDGELESEEIAERRIAA
jgi:hypothetical protein